MLSGENTDNPQPSSQGEYEEAWEILQKQREKEEKEFHFVFVYGSLMTGFGNNVRLGDSKLVMDCAVTQKRMCMVDLVAYPGVVKALEEPSSPSARARFKSLYSPIKGQVFKVTTDTLKNSLDVLEGNGSYYTRELLKIRDLDKIENGPKDGKAWIYILPKEFLTRSPCLTNEENLYCWRNHSLVKRAYQHQKDNVNG